MRKSPILTSVLMLVAVTSGSACSDEADDNATGGADALGEMDPQVPPASKAEMAAWLDAFKAEGWESAWVCEPTATDKLDGAAAIHVHGKSNRVCSNQLLATAAPGSPVPLGAAGLKFVGDGIYVEVKVQADSADGQGWFWYSPGGTVAERGAMDCVGCHGAAGSDADHPGLGDYVYFRVAP